MKKYRAFLALALGLCLFGCGREEPAEPTPAVPENPPAQSGILTDVGQAETVQDYYDRTAIIARNEWVEGDFAASRTWAEEYARLKHPDRQAEITFAGGYSMPRGLFRDELGAGYSLWDIALTDTEGGAETVQVQILHFGETADHVYRQCLSGLLTGEDMLTDRPQTYDYLMLDTRFASRMQPLPEVPLPEKARVLELSRQENGGTESTCLLSPRYLAVFAQVIREGKTGLRVLDLDTGETVVSWEKEGYWYQADSADGELLLRNSGYREDGLTDYVRLRLEDGLPVLREEALEEERWMVGDTTVTHWENGLWAGDRLLLQGNLGEEDATETTNYGVLAVLDDHRFLYGCYGWEWMEYYGVFDLQTDTWKAVWDEPDGYLWVPQGGDRALGYQWVSDWQWGFSLVDLTTGESSPLELGYPSEDQAFQGFVTADGHLTRLAMVDTSDPTQYQVILRELPGGREVLRWSFPEAAVQGQPQIQLVDDMLLVTLTQYATDTSWVYLFDLSGEN